MKTTTPSQHSPPAPGLQPLSVKCYGRLRIHPLTEDGFVPPYSTEEGWNQGDNPSGDPCQAGELAVGGALPHPTDLCVPPSPTGVPFSNLSFSDNRRLIRPNLQSLVTLTLLCTRAMVAKGGLVHMDKLWFFAFAIHNATLCQLAAPVPRYLTNTLKDNP